MAGGDYILGLLTIVTGLAISDMIVSLHGLLVNRRQIKWDWLALIAAAFVLVIIVDTWRISYHALEDAVKGPPIWIFLIILAMMIGLYLAARAALPDSVTIGEPFDLGSYYDFVDRYLWSALAVPFGGVLLFGGLDIIYFGKMLNPDHFLQALMVFPVLLALVIWPNRKLHRIVVPLIFIWFCVRVLPVRLLVV
jgi:hypothetical protein